MWFQRKTRKYTIKKLALKDAEEFLGQICSAQLCIEEMNRLEKPTPFEEFAIALKQRKAMITWIKRIYLFLLQMVADEIAPLIGSKYCAHIMKPS